MVGVGFAAPEITIREGVEQSVCIQTVSVMGGEASGLIEGVFFAVDISYVNGTVFIQFNRTVSIAREVGSTAFCAGTSQFLDDDNIVQGTRQFLLSASVTVDGPESVTFVPGRDRANITVLDNDGMYCSR